MKSDPIRIFLFVNNITITLLRMSNHPEENKCPICLDILSKHDSCVFAGHQDSCRHEFCLDCLNDYFGHVVAENDYISPITFECPVCKTEYLVFEGI